MINLLQSGINLDKALEEHWNYFKCFINTRLNGVKDDPDCKDCDPNQAKRQYIGKSAHYSRLKKFVLEEGFIEQVITGNPKVLEEKHNQFIEEFDSVFQKGSFEEFINLKTEEERKIQVAKYDYIKDLRAIFSYSYFNGCEPKSNGYSPYKLAKNLNVRSCTFCNRTYTVTREKPKGGKLMRPQFDHWYPKSKYPLLAVSFFNLIPCCSICNSSIKRDSLQNLTDHLHPYMDEDSPDDVSFGYCHFNSRDEYRIFVKKSYSASGKSLRTLKELSVDEMYNAHHPELEDLIRIKKAYGKEYIDQMAKFFPKTGLSEEEVYRLLFGTELSKESFHKRPLSKFKYDILKELGIIT